jgi:hypothetical protein
MIKHFQHIILFLFAAFFFGCGKPGPTELVDDRPSEEFPLQYEVLAKNPEDALYKNGYDSTGLLMPPPVTDGLLFISKNVVSQQSLSISYDVAQVFFFDRWKPFLLPDGKRFGFHLKKMFPPKINSVQTKEVSHHLSYGMNVSVKDTGLGPKYVLNSVAGFGDSLSLNYNSPVNFEYRKGMMSPYTSFRIDMPEKIVGNVTVTQNGKGEKFLLLEWNKGTKDSVEIIIGGKIKNEKAATAFFKIHVKDNGNVKIPAPLLRAIPKSRFDRLVITFVRNAVSRRVEPSFEFFTVIQNTHSIIIDYP